MPYNLRPRNTTVAKRPDGNVLLPRKRPRKGAKLAKVPLDGSVILRKEVSRPLGLFESLFAAYPVVQSIVQHLSTPDVMSLCITTPHLWRLLAENRSFHVFSNHHNVLDLAKPIRTLKEYYSRNIFEKFFGKSKDIERLFSQYLDLTAITHLVLDWTDVGYGLLLSISKKANLKLLSLKHCRNLTLEGIETLLDPTNSLKGLHEEYPSIYAKLQPKLTNTFLGDLESLSV